MGRSSRRGRPSPVHQWLRDYSIQVAAAVTVVAAPIAYTVFWGRFAFPVWLGISFVLALIVAAVLRRRLLSWGLPALALVHLITMSALLLLFNGINTGLIQWHQQQLRDPRVLETTLRQWLHEGGFSLGPSISSPDNYFNFEVVDWEDRRFHLFQTKDIGRLLAISVTIEIGNDMYKAVDQLTAERFSPLLSDLRIELSRLGFEHKLAFARPGGLLREVTIQKRFPVEGLTEFELLRTMHTVRQTTFLIEELIFRAIFSRTNIRGP